MAKSVITKENVIRKSVDSAEDGGLVASLLVVKRLKSLDLVAELRKGIVHKAIIARLAG